MDKKDKTLSVLSIIFSSALFIGFIYLMILAVDLFASIANYDPNGEGLESLGFALGFVVYLVIAIIALVPTVISLIVSIVGVKREVRVCKWCMIASIIMIVIIYLCLLLVYLFAISKGIVTFG